MFMHQLVEKNLYGRWYTFGQMTIIITIWLQGSHFFGPTKFHDISGYFFIFLKSDFQF